MKEQNMEQMLIDRLKNGDKQAFSEVFDMYNSRIYRLAYRFVNNQTDAEDITQEVFITVYRKIGFFEGKSSFFSWIYRITVNKCMRFLKYKSLQAEKHSMLSEKKEVNMKQEIKNAINRAIDSLGEKYKKIVIMHDMEGFSHKEISGILNCPEGTVWSSLYYARKQLRVELQKYI